DLDLLVGRERRIRLVLEDAAGRVEDLGAVQSQAVARAAPGERPQQAARVSEIATSCLVLERVGPGLLVDLLVIGNARELRAQHREDRAAVGPVIPLSSVLTHV